MSGSDAVGHLFVGFCLGCELYCLAQVVEVALRDQSAVPLAAVGIMVAAAVFCMIGSDMLRMWRERKR